MAIAALQVEVKARWWVKSYLASCFVFAELFGCEADVDKMVNFVVAHGLRVRVL